MPPKTPVNTPYGAVNDYDFETTKILLSTAETLSDDIRATADKLSGDVRAMTGDIAHIFEGAHAYCGSQHSLTFADDEATTADA